MSENTGEIFHCMTTITQLCESGNNHKLNENIHLNTNHDKRSLYNSQYVKWSLC